MKDLIEKLQHASAEFVDGDGERGLGLILAALAQLEAMVGEQEPFAYVYSGIRFNGELHGPHLIWNPREMDAMSAQKGAKAEPLYRASPVAQQPQAEPDWINGVPNVCASFFTESAELIGTTKAPIKRVEWEDDGTLHVYIDHWPQQAEVVPSDVVRDADLALDLLSKLFNAYENGLACYEEPDEQAGYVGNAVELDADTFHACADLLNRRRPIAAIAQQKGSV